jgi:hypothetical protein
VFESRQSRSIGVYECDDANGVFRGVADTRLQCSNRRDFSQLGEQCRKCRALPRLGLAA